MIYMKDSGHSQASRAKRASVHYDYWLIGVVMFLICLGLIMVASSSITIADRIYHNPLYFFWRQGIAVVLGLTAGIAILKIPLVFWQRLNVYLLLLGILLLTIVLVPGIGREVNGSMRWIHLGIVNIQGSEYVKIFIIIYMAGYLVRQEEGIRTTLSGFIKPIAIVTFIAALLLLEPDYGTAAVLFAAALGLLFVGGVPLSRFIVWVLTAFIALCSLAIISPYRMLRLTSFLDPWQDPYNSGFQLTQALIAFGRGGWLGTGLGSSIQKLFYLPESHTDFVFAVLAEELGLIGSVMVILLFFYITWRAFVIAQIAQQADKLFAAYLAYGIGLLIGLQAFINIGVNTGLLPTKGLVLPLLSYGSNSMISNCILLALLVRIEYENHFLKRNEIPEAVTSYVATGGV
jgi:cell division protein FtsW